MVCLHRVSLLIVLFISLSGNVFRGFSEQPISFAPSYKFDTNSDTYDTSEKKRVPSWTVRLCYVKTILSLNCSVV